MSSEYETFQYILTMQYTNLFLASATNLSLEAQLLTFETCPRRNKIFFRGGGNFQNWCKICYFSYISFVLTFCLGG